MNTSLVRTAALHMLLGAAAFWLPDILIKILTRNGTTWPLLTPMLPVSSFGLYSFYQRKTRSETSVAMWTLAGIYFFGPLFMLLTATLQGGGPRTMHHVDYWFIPLDMLLPPLTLLLSGYDQSFFAIIIVTIGFAVIRFRYEDG